MRHNRKRIYYNTNGVTLVEIIVAVAILGVVTFVIADALTMNFKFIAKSRLKQETNSIIKEFDDIFSSESSCGETLRGLAIVPGNLLAEIPLTDVHYARTDATSPSGFSKSTPPAFSVGMIREGVLIESMSVQPIEQLRSSPVQLLSELILKARDPSSSNSYFKVPKLRFIIELDAAGNQIEACYAPGGGATLKEKLCAMKSDGNKKYDPVTEVCVDAYDYQWQNTGSKDTASCDTANNWEVMTTCEYIWDCCWAKAPDPWYTGGSAYGDPYFEYGGSAPVPFLDIFTTTSQLPNGNILVNNNHVGEYEWVDPATKNSCLCLYAEDMRNNGWENNFTCQIMCQKEKP